MDAKNINKELFDNNNCVHHSDNININDCTIPLVVSYENNFNSNTNSQLFQKTLEKNNWEYMIIGENTHWKGFKTRIECYYKMLQQLPKEKIIILTDARDVFCVRTPFHFMEDIKDIINFNKIIVSAEMFLLGYMEWSEESIANAVKLSPNFFWQGVPLNNYWKYHNKTKDLPLRKYLNAGLVIGKVSDLLKSYEWMIFKNYSDDQLAFAEYTNEFPDLIHLDYEANILHTSTFGVDGGLYDQDKQKEDSPTFAEFCGLSSYFLHIPGSNISKGQKYIYDTISTLLITDIIKINALYNLYNLKPNLKKIYFNKNY